MKINKDWKPSIVTCPKCNKKFTVKFELGTGDNCLSIISRYHIDKIFRSQRYIHQNINTEASHLASPENVLQWLDIGSVMFICPHCHNNFGSNESCRACGKPLYVWMETIGATCSPECSLKFQEYLNERDKRDGARRNG